MDTTPNLALPYLYAAQAQKHVTHNEALRALDAVAQIGVLDRHLAAPPASPTEGARWIVAAGATGAWAGQIGKIAAWQDAAWAFYSPREGWIAWVADEDILVAFDGTNWVAASGGLASVNPTPLVGVNATADTTNRLAVSAPAILLNHEGAGHQAKINKAAATDTASFLFQTAFSGRAEMGTTGDDDFHFKVSPDGTTWKDALQINKTTGVVTMPFTPGGGGGEANTASNVNTGGVGVFKQKSGVNLEFRGINAASGAISVALEAATNEIDIDVPDNGIGNAKLADVPTATFKGRTTAGTGDPEDLTVAQAKTLLNLAGTNNGDQTITLTGDVTGSGTGSFAATIANDAVTNAKLANMAANSIKGNNTGAAADPIDLTAAQVKTLLAIAAADVSGLAASATTDTTNASNIATGTLGSARLPAFGSGDVSFAAAGGAGTIANDAVTNAKLANMAANTIKGNNTGVAADPIDLTAAQVKTFLAIAAGDVSGLATIATSGSASDLAAGTVPAARMPAHTGDVTSTAGSVALTIANDAVTNAKLANMAANSIKGNNTGAAADPIDLTAAQVKTLLAIAAADVSGLAASATTDTTNASNIATGTLGAARLPAFGSGDVSFAAAGGAGTIANNAVTYAKLQDVSAASRLLGRGDSGSGDPQEITLGAGLSMTGTVLSSSGGGGSITTQDEGVTLSAGVTTLNFVGAGVTASGAGATTTVTIPGGSGSPGGSTGQLQFNNAGSFGGASGLTYDGTSQELTLVKPSTFADQATAPSAPASGLKLYSRDIAGYAEPAMLGPNGGPIGLARNRYRGRVAEVAAQANSTGTSNFGTAAPTIAGASTARSMSSTSLLTSQKRVGYSTSAATAGSSTGIRLGNSFLWRGNAAGLGGFFFSTRFSITDAAAVADARMFAGLYATSAVIGNVNPSTLLNIVGVGTDNAQTTLRIMHNDGAGAATTIDLGANFPANTLSVDVYDLILFCPPNASSIQSRVERLNTGHVATGTITTDLPVNTLFLNPQIWRNNGATALTVSIDFLGMFMETEL